MSSIDILYRLSGRAGNLAGSLLTEVGSMFHLWPHCYAALPRLFCTKLCRTDINKNK